MILITLMESHVQGHYSGGVWAAEGPKRAHKLIQCFCCQSMDAANPIELRLLPLFPLCYWRPTEWGLHDQHYKKYNTPGSGRSLHVYVYIICMCVCKCHNFQPQGCYMRNVNGCCYNSTPPVLNSGLHIPITTTMIIIEQIQYILVCAFISENENYFYPMHSLVHSEFWLDNLIITVLVEGSTDYII